MTIGGQWRSALRRLVLATVLVASPGYAAETFLSTFGGSEADGALDLRETATGDLLVVGTTSLPGSKALGWVLRLDADGNLLEERTFGSTTVALGSGIDGAAIAADGSLLYAGRDVLEFFTIHHAWVVRIDPDFDIRWATRLFTPPDGAGLGRYFLHDLTITTDGGIVAAGSTAVTDGDPSFAYIVKLDADGALVWQHKYDGGPLSVHTVIETADLGFLVAGPSSAGGGLGDASAMKLSADGTPQWQTALGGTDQDEATGAVELAAGGFALSGWSGSWTASGRAGWAARLDELGQVVWYVVFGDAEWSDFQDVQLTRDGTLILTGRIGEPGFPSNDLWLVKLDPADGSVLWQRAYAGDQGDYGVASRELADGALFTVGTWAWGFPEEDVWAMRLGATGALPGCPLLRDTAVVASSPRLIVTPGPATVLAPDAVTGLVEMVSAAAPPMVDRRCSATCPDQGNVLLGVKEGQVDVRLRFPTAPSSLWRIYKDLGKRSLGVTAVADPPAATFLDPGAVATAADYYYQVRGLCDGVPGP